MNGTLYIVATPIGNLADISSRALDTLKSVSVVYAEDTRVSAKLLKAYEIETPMESFHQHSSSAKTERIIEQLQQGADIALISDAGTPGINDPGGLLIQSVLEQLPDVTIVPMPGPNAAIVALSISGFPADTFRYRGFVPQKKGRQTFMQSVAQEADTQVFYESKYRIEKLLEGLAEAFEQSDQEHRSIVLARELTKKHETIYRGNVVEVLAQLKESSVLGEFVVVIGPAPKS